MQNMLKKIFSKKLVLIVVFLLFISSLTYSIYSYRRLSRRLNEISTRADKLKDDVTGSERGLYGQIGYINTVQRPSYYPQSNALYFPEARIYLPFGDLASTVRYGFSSDSNELDIMSTNNLDQDSGVFGNKPTQFSCDGLLRISFDSGAGAYSPWEKKTAPLS